MATVCADAADRDLIGASVSRARPVNAAASAKDSQLTAWSLAKRRARLVFRSSACAARYFRTLNRLCNQQRGLIRAVIQAVMSTLSRVSPDVGDRGTILSRSCLEGDGDGDMHFASR